MYKRQRLNSLVFQYMQEDIGTVASMIWNGFPVLRLLLAWALATLLLAWLFRRIERATRARGHAAPPRWPVRTAVFVLLLLCLLYTSLPAQVRQVHRAGFHR